MKDELARRRNALPSARLTVRMYYQVLRSKREHIVSLMAAVMHLMELERRGPILPVEVLDGFCAALEIDITVVDARKTEILREEALESNED